MFEDMMGYSHAVRRVLINLDEGGPVEKGLAGAGGIC